MNRKKLHLMTLIFQTSFKIHGHSPFICLLTIYPLIVAGRVFIFHLSFGYKLYHFYYDIPNTINEEVEAAALVILFSLY